MTIIKKLKEKSDTSNDDVKIELKLYNLADDLEKQARNHLKRIATILPKFDIHDEKHSEKVIENIEKLLGNDSINELSCYELFLLQLSAFFHDCAMAPSDWEINTMKLTEGNEKFIIEKNSLKHDLKPPLKISTAIEYIKNNKTNIYHTFDNDVKKWIFSPSNEKALIEYLASLLVDYQNFRNGYADKFRKLKNQDEFVELNQIIRTDYIRITHHLRIETYIKHLENKFSSSFEQPAWGKKLSHDLAIICRSHGENVDFINQLSTNSQYYGSESANLQMIAIMLRLGDIIHFSFDRAPIELRSSKLFNSEYSFQQWAIKSNGVNYSIENGLISFRAYCETPEVYFKLHEYIDWIDYEILKYFKFQRQWNLNYIKDLQEKVNRKNITNDSDNFLPKLGLSFSLNQKKIIELLMGVGLYKNKYACLRELYQNSLDACRCMLSLSNVARSNMRGEIEFYLKRDEEKTYLCCRDNGIGMTKDIVEKYLLNIGNSYYKSSDFYKQQALWGGGFTPTSQFGIGILSSFMIGDRIEITSKSYNGDYLSCSIDGPHENFYYKKVSQLDRELLPVSGTIIQILLNEQSLSDKGIEKLGLLLLGIDDHLPEKFQQYLDCKDKWDNHLYNILNQFVEVIPDNISVRVKLESGNSMEIYSKPILITLDDEKLGITGEDADFIDYLNNSHRFYPLNYKFSDIEEYVENYEIKIINNSLEYITILTLPQKEFLVEGVTSLHTTPKHGATGICIDGISFERDNVIGLSHYYTDALKREGVLNFIGELRPQLSVDRTSIVAYPVECEKEAEVLSLTVLKEILNKAKYHIERFNIEPDSPVFNLLWEYIFEKIGFADTLFINELSHTEYGEIVWKGIKTITGKDISIKNFLVSKEVELKEFNLASLDILTKKIILSKLISAKSIKVQKNSLFIDCEGFLNTNLIEKRNSISDHELLIKSDEWKVDNNEYDIVSNLYPLIPERLFNLLDKMHVQIVNERLKIVHAFSNGITAFFTQSPLLISETLGLYMTENSFGKKQNEIFNFERKCSRFALFELNERFYMNKQKEVYFLVVFISPRELTKEEEKELSKIEDKEVSYTKGVKEGWSILVTSMEKENIVIIPGKCSRKELVDRLSDDFWEEYKDVTFRFTDGNIVKIHP